MSFRIAARAILHLGAELISSDEIALYELRTVHSSAIDRGANQLNARSHWVIDCTLKE
ncbi:MAG: hypothetical protein WBG92_09945 [Thiohalocapsa sp.]